MTTPLDLADLENVRAFADRVLASDLDAPSATT
jgi:hypothetical protein